MTAGKAHRRFVQSVGVASALLWAAVALNERAVWRGEEAWLLAAGVVAGLALGARATSMGRALLVPPRWAFDGACALAAAGVSLWFLRAGLREQPVLIDASVYLFQARAMAHGHFGMPIPSPAQAFSMRFLFEGHDGRLYGVFPPGWPLAIVPFVWLGAPGLVGPVVAALLVLAQAALGRSLGAAADDAESIGRRADSTPALAGELATRASLVLGVPTYARAIETSELASHAWVAVLSATALALALRVGPGATRTFQRAAWQGALIGGCIGWAFAARLLDGLVLAGAVAGLLVWRRAGLRTLAWASLGALPWVALLAAEQRCATGSWMVPTQAAYFARTDWPPTCHRLGFGADVGCTVEHASAVQRFGDAGYDAHAALAVVRERAGVLGADLFGYAPLALFAFAPLAVAGSAVDAVCVGFVLALTVAYGLFYYSGNSPLLGARHLFPVAPFFWLLAARGATLVMRTSGGASWGRRARGAALPLLLLVSIAAARGPWKTRGRQTRDYQASRSDLRRTLAEQGVDRGILRARDEPTVAAAFDSWQDDDRRLLVADDGSGLVELRRAHPDLPVFLSLPGEETGRLLAAPPPPGVLVELEREWPSLVRPSGLAVRRMREAGASGGMVLLLSHAAPGAFLTMPFEIARSGEYALRIDALAGPDQGDYDFELDDRPLAEWRGYAAESTPLQGERTTWTLAEGRHRLRVLCTGKDAASSGYDARLDVLAGEPVP